MTRAWAFARIIFIGVVIQVIGVSVWIVTASLNARFYPEWPWAAAVTLLFLALYLWWLNGGGWPKSASAARRFNLRLWRPPPEAWSGENRTTLIGLIAAMVLLYVFWVAIPQAQSPPDLSAYPTTALRISVFAMGALVSGITEEAAFRGYMQSGLERFGAAPAIITTSIVFVLLHVTHGWLYLITVAPGFFLASVVYGWLALKSGSILPGMALHVLGDAGYVYFVLLGGDPRLLIAH